ncbi:MAG: hypothetical protein FWE05_06525 [Defluviitaleaceae bacterium]|nr:hypothetical protein [Defluviitaleaceae bacterium]
MHIIVAVLVLVVLAACFIGSYLLNKRIPVPEGTDVSDTHCHGCTIKSCRNYGKHNE